MPSISNFAGKIARSEGDPKLLKTGTKSLAGVDVLGKALGWFSIGLGLAELFAPGRITRALGLEDRDALVRTYGVREIGAGVLCLSIDKPAGLWSRVAGDGLDIATLLTGLKTGRNKQSVAVTAAMALVLGITALDILAASASTTRHRRGRGEKQLYRDRSGYPNGIGKSRGAAASNVIPHPALSRGGSTPSGFAPA